MDIETQQLKEELVAVRRTLGELSTVVHLHRHTEYDKTKTLAGGTTHIGAVTSAGAATFLPPQWTSSKQATGQYRVTHNLGHTNYSVVASTRDVGTALYTGINPAGSAYFDIHVYDDTGVKNYDAATMFILVSKT